MRLNSLPFRIVTVILFVAIVGVSSGWVIDQTRNPRKSIHGVWRNHEAESGQRSLIEFGSRNSFSMILDQNASYPHQAIRFSGYFQFQPEHFLEIHIDRTELAGLNGETIQQFNEKTVIKIRYAVDPAGQLLIHEFDRRGFEMLDAHHPLGEFYFERYQASQQDIESVWGEWLRNEPESGK